MIEYFVRPFLVRAYGSSRILWNSADVEVFKHEARQEIRRKNPNKLVTNFTVVEFVDWPFTVIDVKYRLEGETEDRYLRSSGLGRWIERQARNMPSA